MKMNKTVARLAVTAGLSLTMGLGSIVAPMAAFAGGEAGGAVRNSITITATNGNDDVKYQAYQIFKADVVDNGSGGKTASNVQWANGLDDTVKKGIIDAINKSAEEGSQLKANPTAQDVADWLTANVHTTKTTRVGTSDVLYKIADIVKQDVAPTAPTGADDEEEASDTSFAAGDCAKFGSNGYYLFLTDESTLSTDQNASPNTGTSPIFAVIGGEEVDVNEKTSIPTVEKKILNDSKNKTAENADESDWSIVGDSQVGQEVDYKLSGTVADNIASFDTYNYEFQDTLSKGLEVVKGTDGTPKDLHVYIVNGNAKTEVKIGFAATVTPATDETKNSEELKVSFTDLKGVKDSAGAAIAVDGNSKVVVTYKAKLNSNVSYEAAGNPNTVKLVYSNNPMAEGTGTSVEQSVTDHAFRLDITKEAQGDPNTKLQAGFKVQVVAGANEDSDSVDKWLREDGSLTGNKDEACEFMTNEETGEVYIPGLDAGKYQITETSTPSGYNTIAPFTITVTPTYDENGMLTNLTVTDDSDMVTPGAASGAAIPVTIQNKKGSGLPLTGLNGVTFTWVAGGAVLAIGVAHLIRSRKQVEESEQE